MNDSSDTGRHAFEAALDAALRRADDERLPVGIVIGECAARPRDIGSAAPARDHAVSAPFEAIEAAARHKGALFRLADDRFALVLPNFDLGEATALADRCARAFDAAAEETGLVLLAGAAAYPHPASTRDALVADAERMIQQARRFALDADEARAAASAGADAFRSDDARSRGSFTGPQLEHMRLSYFQHRIVTCPNDGTFLRAQEVHEIGRTRPTVIVRCPRCGLQARL